MIRPLLLLAFLMTAAASAATGEETAPPSGWDIAMVTTDLDVKGSAQADMNFDTLRLWTADPTQPEIRFACSERYGMRATITFEPAENIDSSDSYLRTKSERVSMWIDGDRDVSAWTVVRRMRAIQTRSTATSAKVYNAVVQGKPITFSEPYKGKITLTPPPYDENFKLFAKHCHITSTR